MLEVLIGIIYRLQNIYHKNVGLNSLFNERRMVLFLYSRRVKCSMLLWRNKTHSIYLRLYYNKHIALSILRFFGNY